MSLVERPSLFRLMWLMCLAALAGCTAAAPKEPNPASATAAPQASLERVFQGAWFEISYPADFTPVPSLPSRTAEGWDSAAFISPDGGVSFYVYAPQWGGEPTDIALDAQREALVSEKRAEEDGRQIRWVTICAQDGSYCRSYQDTTARQGTVRTTLGIKYRDEEARRRYLPAYLKFRHSLQQFAD
jgi:hypothetical protein